MKTHSTSKLGATAAIAAMALLANLTAPATRAAAQDDTTTTGAAPAAQSTIAPTATYWDVTGNRGRFQQDLGQRAGLATGIQDFSYRKDAENNIHVDINGHAIFGNEDYLIDFKLQRDDWFKIGFGYKQFFTPSNADGLYFNNNGNAAFGSDLANVTNQMGVTRGLFWFDAQTLFPNFPTITLHYDRATRHGDTGSTIMAPYNIPGIATNPARAILPAYRNINNTIDTISLDVDQKFKTWAYGAGVWGQHTTTNDATYSVTNAGKTTGASNHTTNDTLGAHAYATGDINKNLTYGAGALYNQFEYDIDNGGRWTFPGTEQIYDPTTRADKTPLNYKNLLGETTYKEWAASANLNWRPAKNWFIVPTISFQNYRTDVMTNYIDVTNNSNPYVDSGNNWFQSTEALEIRYTGLKNWTHTLNAEFSQGTGSNNFSTTGRLNNNANPADIHSTTNQTRYTTKIACTANWYARPGLSLSGQYYYKNNRNNYDTPWATHTATINYPGYMSFQGFETNDLNIRMTWRPISWISNVIRYDYQRSTVDTAYYTTHATTNTTSDTARTGKTQTHIISEVLTLTPHPRVNISLNGSVVYDQTALSPDVYLTSSTVPTATYNSGYQTVINADNNYFNAGFNIYYAATDLDDVFLDYNYYKAWNGGNNAAVTMPYGDNEHQYIINLGWVRRFNANLQVNLGYTYAYYRNRTQGGNLDYHANGITATLRYKF